MRAIRIPVRDRRWHFSAIIQQQAFSMLQAVDALP